MESNEGGDSGSSWPRATQRVLAYVNPQWAVDQMPYQRRLLS